MNNHIANILKAYLEELPFKDTVAGLVKTIEYTGNDNKIIKFPASVDSNTTPTNRNWQYADLVPNSKKKSIMYFEDKGLKTGGKNKYGVSFESDLRLVCWLNDELANDPLAVVSVINCLPDQPVASRPFSSIKITAGSIYGIEDNIFSKYSYHENLNQFLMKPFSAFAIDLKVAFNASLNCLQG